MYERLQSFTHLSYTKIHVVVFHTQIYEKTLVVYLGSISQQVQHSFQSTFYDIQSSCDPNGHHTVVGEQWVPLPVGVQVNRLESPPRLGRDALDETEHRADRDVADRVDLTIFEEGVVLRGEDEWVRLVFLGRSGDRSAVDLVEVKAPSGGDVFVEEEVHHYGCFVFLVCDLF